MAGPDPAARRALEKATGGGIGGELLPQEGEFHVSPLTAAAGSAFLLQHDAGEAREAYHTFLFASLCAPSQYYNNFSGFKERVAGFRGRLQAMLTSLPVRAPPNAKRGAARAD